MERRARLDRLIERAREQGRLRHALGVDDTEQHMCPGFQTIIRDLMNWIDEWIEDEVEELSQYND